MNQTPDQLAAELAELLAASSLDKKIKDIILTNAGKIPEALIFRLIDALKADEAGIEMITEAIEAKLAEQDVKWAGIAESQKQVASEMGDQLFEKLKDNI